MIKCIIVDDEPLAIDVLKSYCENAGGIEILDCFTNAIKALEFINSHQIDLVLTDIEMPQINGVEFIKALEQRPLFIFTTAYPDFALEGFELNAIDYLVKPIPFPRFLKAINRVKQACKTTNQENNELLNFTPLSGEKTSERPYMFLKSDYGNTKVNTHEIIYIQGLKDYLKIHINDHKPVLTLMNFKEMESRLPDSYFFRIHRSFIVNINYIKTVQKNKVVIGEQRLPIGASFKPYFFDRIGIK